MINVDRSLWPVIVIRFEGDVTLGEHANLYDELDELIAMETPCGIVIDHEAQDGWTEHSSHLFRAWIERNAENVQRYCAGGAAKVSNPFTRKAAQPVLARMVPFPIKLVKSLDDGVIWVARQIEMATQAVG
ncbi:MAG: hypothetical protein KDB86_02890 [Actinobacteria bacterium]|nr:hypothetical protein [Actinomycetota bacterium]MCB9388711.1 hypothetical protein [Acidimicrobiia bacterium]